MRVFFCPATSVKGPFIPLRELTGPHTKKAVPVYFPVLFSVNFFLIQMSWDSTKRPLALIVERLVLALPKHNDGISGRQLSEEVQAMTHRLSQWKGDIFFGRHESAVRRVPHLLQTAPCGVCRSLFTVVKINFLHPHLGQRKHNRHIDLTIWLYALPLTVVNAINLGNASINTSVVYFEWHANPASV